MNKQIQIEQIREMAVDFLQTEPEYFCVDVRIKPTNNIKIFIDGDSGISIEKCVFFNRGMYKIIEEKNWFPDGDFSLEVSSPGIDQPLRLSRQYIKNKGRFVEIITQGGEKKQGVLIGATTDNVTIEYTEGKGKMAHTKQETIPFISIKTTIVQIKF